MKNKEEKRNFIGIGGKMVNNKLLNDLKSLGVKMGDTILMHSSLKGLNANITPKEVIDTLINLLTEEGTLILPSFSYRYVKDETPYFDVNSTPSCIGAIPEFFRTNYNVIRSLHPTHSVCAIGKNASKITAKHHLDNTPVGINSPISRLSDFDGKVLMLGCGLSPSTFVHGAEEIACASYCLKKDSFKYFIKDSFGETIEFNYIRHNFKNTEQRYDRLEDLLPVGVLTKSELLNGTGYLINHKQAMPIVVNKIKKDDLFFINYLSE